MGIIETGQFKHGFGSLEQNGSFGTRQSLGHGLLEPQATPPHVLGQCPVTARRQRDDDFAPVDVASLPLDAAQTLQTCNES